MPEQHKQDEAVPNEPGDSATAIAPAKNAPAKKPALPKRKPEQLPPFKVLLHNDDVNTFEHVIKGVARLTTLSTQEALLRTIEAHDTGVSLLLVTHRERAELYVEQFASLTITVTCEPADP